MAYPERGAYRVQRRTFNDHLCRGNLSATGALLRVESVLGVPPDFTLSMDDGTKYRCKMVRRSGTEIGVKFDQG